MGEIPDLIIFDKPVRTDVFTVSRFTITRTHREDIPTLAEFARDFDELVLGIIEFLYPQPPSSNSQKVRRLSSFNTWLPALEECCKCEGNKIVIVDQQTFNERFGDVISFIRIHQLEFTNLEIKNAALLELVDTIDPAAVKRKALGSSMYWPMFPESVNFALACYAPDFESQPTLYVPHQSLRVTDELVIDVIRSALK